MAVYASDLELILLAVRLPIKTRVAFCSFVSFELKSQAVDGCDLAKGIFDFYGVVLWQSLGLPQDDKDGYKQKSGCNNENNGYFKALCKCKERSHNIVVEYLLDEHKRLNQNRTDNANAHHCTHLEAIPLIKGCRSF